MKVLPVPVASVNRIRSVPPAMASDREVLAYVRLTPGAIGYVSLGADITAVKVIAVAGRNTVAPPAAA